jgi:hypothetical protein
MEPHEPQIPAGPPGERRVRGFPVLVGIVVLGLASGVGWFQAKRPAIAAARARFREELAAAPQDLEGRLDLWMRFGEPQIHHRLTKFARFSPEHPWMVTHAVRSSDGGDPTLWGVDCEALGPGLVRREGTVIVVAVPAPVPLGRVPLTPRMGEHIPVAEPGETFDGAERLRTLVLYLLDRIPQALEREIAGARLEVRVGTP